MFGKIAKTLLEIFSNMWFAITACHEGKTVFWWAGIPKWNLFQRTISPTKRGHQQVLKETGKGGKICGWGNHHTYIAIKYVSVNVKDTLFKKMPGSWFV